MGRKLSADEIARCECGRDRAPRRTFRHVLGTLLLALLLAGCAASGATSDKDSHHGFYGGISAGGTLP